MLFNDGIYTKYIYQVQTINIAFEIFIRQRVFLTV